MEQLNFFSENIKFEYHNETYLNKWIVYVVEQENYIIKNLNFIFTNDDYLLEINKKYLKHNYYTDVITFDYVEENNVSGDIFISIDRIKENAKMYNVDFIDELNRIIIHGVLHLLGYKDKLEIEKLEMTQKENFYLKSANSGL